MNQPTEIFIRSEHKAETLLYSTTMLFSVRHELYHAELFRTGIPLTNTERCGAFRDPGNYMRMVVIAGWYISELQEGVFHEYCDVDGAGTPTRLPS